MSAADPWDLFPRNSAFLNDGNAAHVDADIIEAAAAEHQQRQQAAQLQSIVRRNSFDSVDAGIARDAAEDEIRERKRTTKRKRNSGPQRPRKRARISAADDAAEAEAEDETEEDSADGKRAQPRKSTRVRRPVQRDVGLRGEDLEAAAARDDGSEAEEADDEAKEAAPWQPMHEPVDMFQEERYDTDDDDEAELVQEEVSSVEKLASQNSDLDGYAQDVFGVQKQADMPLKRVSRRKEEFCFMCSFSPTNPNGDTVPMYSRLVRTLESLIANGATDRAIVDMTRSIYQQIRQARPSLPVWKGRTILEHLYDHAPDHLLTARRADRVYGRMAATLEKGQLLQRDPKTNQVSVNAAAARLYMQLQQIRTRGRRDMDSNVSASVYSNRHN